MKIFSATQIRALDQTTIKNEPIASIDLMERASERFTNWVLKNILEKNRHISEIYVFAGMGNNGGDGLAVARMLQKKGYTIRVFVVRFTKQGSPDFEINLKRLSRIVEVDTIEEIEDIPSISKNALVIDAIFGSGLSREIKGIAGNVIQSINQSNCTVASIDIPSGIYSDDLNVDSNKVVADYVLSFQFPKAAFFMKENEAYIKSWSTEPIGLLPKAIEETQTDKFLIESQVLKGLLKHRGKFSHKGTYGHLLLMAGSKGKMGAAQLTAKAALKAGVGLLTTHVPNCGYDIMQLAVPEAMSLTDTHQEVLTTFPDLDFFKSVAIGPGIGTGPQTSKMLASLLPKLKSATVFDADALNILSQNPSLLNQLPENSILTPHPKEFERLVGKTDSTPQQWEKLIGFSKQYKVITILKGAYTAFSDSEGNIYFNNTGNPGMATGGSGDVLTGIIAGLLTSGYAPLQAAKLGVHLHGLAGDLAAKEMGQEALTASDLIQYLGKAFLTLQSL